MRFMEILQKLLNKKTIFLSTIFLIFDWLYVYWHEKAHWVCYYYHGKKASIIALPFYGRTISQSSFEGEYQYHILVDLIGYQLFPIYTVLTLILIILIVILFKIESKHQ